MIGAHPAAARKGAPAPAVATEVRVPRIGPPTVNAVPTAHRGAATGAAGTAVPVEASVRTAAVTGVTIAMGSVTARTIAAMAAAVLTGANPDPRIAAVPVRGGSMPAVGSAKTVDRRTFGGRTARVSVCAVTVTADARRPAVGVPLDRGDAKVKTGGNPAWGVATAAARTLAIAGKRVGATDSAPTVSDVEITKRIGVRTGVRTVETLAETTAGATAEGIDAINARAGHTTDGMIAATDERKAAVIGADSARTVGVRVVVAGQSTAISAMLARLAVLEMGMAEPVIDAGQTTGRIAARGRATAAGDSVKTVPVSNAVTPGLVRADPVTSGQGRSAPARTGPAREGLGKTRSANHASRPPNWTGTSRAMNWTEPRSTRFDPWRPPTRNQCPSTW